MLIAGAILIADIFQVLESYSILILEFPIKGFLPSLEG